ncbi:hypothetical protein ACCO45_004126 [Purpureocillium lilacinum]|uniref:Uncharacterized protein n=1 Tax=Purpureocillium lilacinum TaxID=33203 RepID=A0ACC4E503_PURLI
MKSSLAVLVTLCAGAAYGETFLGTCHEKKCRVLLSTTPIGWTGRVYRDKQVFQTMACSAPTKCYQDGTACIWDKSANYVRCVA